MGKFTLEKIDQENVKKVDVREDISTVNIPALEKQKVDPEHQLSEIQKKIDKINKHLDKDNQPNN